MLLKLLTFPLLSDRNAFFHATKIHDPPPTVISFPEFDARGHSKVLGDFQPIITKSGMVPNYRLRIIANPKKVETLNQGLGKPYFYSEKVIFQPIQLKIKNGTLA